MDKKKVLAMALAAAMLVSIPMTACSNGNEEKPESEKPAEENKENAAAAETTVEHDFIVATSSDVKTLDPHATNDTPSALVYQQLYNCLVDMDSEGNMLPGLAESWEKVSDTEYAFKLRQGVKFHNGEELKASDVKFSIEREKQGARTAFLVEKIQEVRVDNDYQVSILLSEPDGSLFYNLSHKGSSILNEKAVTEAGEDYALHPIGTGPLKFKEWVPNDHLTLERFSDYYDDSQEIVRSLTFRVVPEATARTITLENGEVDLIGGVAPVDIDRVKNNPALETKFLTSPGIEFLGFNMEREPFNNPLVRQAICSAIDPQGLVDVAMEGHAQVVNTVVGTAVPGYDASIEGYPYDVEKAKALMKEAGFENGFSTVITTSGDVRSQEAQLIQSDLSKIGITVDIELMDWGAYLEAVNAGNMDMYILGWSNTIMDPAVSLYPLFHSRNWGPTGNRMHYKNEEADALLDEMMRESDNDKRMELSSKVQKIVVADAPWKPLMTKEVCTSYTKGITNIEFLPNELNRYAFMRYPVAK